MNRDDILREFGVTQLGQITMHHEDMADEIVHLRRQVRKLERTERTLAALQKPSEAVVDAMLAAHGYPYLQSGANVAILGQEAARCRSTLRAAVAAAEHEVRDD